MENEAPTAFGIRMVREDAVRKFIEKLTSEETKRKFAYEVERIHQLGLKNQSIECFQESKGILKIIEKAGEKP